jgi:hypothetical protein
MGMGMGAGTGSSGRRTQQPAPEVTNAPTAPPRRPCSPCIGCRHFIAHLPHVLTWGACFATNSASGGTPRAASEEDGNIITSLKETVASLQVGGASCLVGLVCALLSAKGCLYYT